jgi:hypothetical protein
VCGLAHGERVASTLREDAMFANKQMRDLFLPQMYYAGVMA